MIPNKLRYDTQKLLISYDIIPLRLKNELLILMFDH